MLYGYENDISPLDDDYELYEYYENDIYNNPLSNDFIRDEYNNDIYDNPLSDDFIRDEYEGEEV